jgi:hypothetical protein
MGFIDRGLSEQVGNEFSGVRITGKLERPEGNCKMQSSISLKIPLERIRG